VEVKKLLETVADVKRTIKFCATSVLGLGLETVVLIFLVEILNSPLLVAKLVGAEASIAAMFILNNRYTYSGEPGKIMTRFLKSNLVRTGGILISLVALEAGVRLGIWYPLANIIGVCIGFAFNYGFETVYTWKEHRF